MEPEKAIADLEQATRIRTADNRVENNPALISARGGAFSKSDVVTARIESMLFAVAGAIKKAEDSAYGFEPMVHSGKDAALIDAFKAGLGAAAIRKDLAAEGERFNIVVRVSGKFETAFPAGPPKGGKPNPSSASPPG